MKRLNRHQTVCFAAMLGMLLLFGVAMAQEAEPNAAGGDQAQQVRTTLEQRMQKRISVDFRDTPIDDVIRIMAEQADVDVVKSPKVIGDVTAKLTNVPLEEALKNILAAHGYDYVASRNMIRIAPTSEISDEAEKLVNKIYRITYADIKGVEKALTKFVSQRGSISSNPGTSNIIVTDAESKIKAIDTFIEEIDRITPQILVEARIYDITSKDKVDLGVEWEAGRATTYPGGVGTNPTGITDPFVVSGFTGKTDKTSSTVGALRFGWLKGSADIDMIIRAQANVIKAKLLANPRILVLDNETANFKVMSEIPYREQSQTSGGGNISSTEFKEVGVGLTVTPHVTKEQAIRLNLVPEFSVQTGSVTLSNTANEYPVPIVDTRKAQTTLLVQNGQTVVLGGLRKKDATKQINKIPLLGDLPLLGLLFRFQGEDTTNSELVVFVTPWIVEKPVMSELEKEQFKITDFAPPKVDWTDAEKKGGDVQ